MLYIMMQHPVSDTFSTELQKGATANGIRIWNPFLRKSF